MTHFAARPLWVMGIVALLVCLIAPWISLDIVRWLLYGGIIAAVVFLIIPFVRRWRIPFVIALACVVASFSYLTAQTRYLSTAAQTGKTVALQVQVKPHQGDSVRLQVLGGDLPKGVGLVLYNNSHEISCEPYQTISAQFRLLSFDNEELSLLQSKASDVWFAVSLEDEQPSCSAGKAPWTDIFYRIRCSATKNIEKVLSKSSAAVVGGICFGEDSKLPLAAVNAFRTCGVTHLFAVSGLHMAVLAQSLLCLLKKCRVPRIAQCVITVGVLWSFMLVVGLSASVLRAGLLCTLVLLGNCLHRQADSRTSLGLALLILLSYNPFAAYDVGLLLSFLSTYGLLIWSGPLYQGLLHIPHKWMGKTVQKWWKTILNGAAVTLSATAATAPVLVVYFGTLSLVSVPSNLLVMLPAEGILILGCLASLIVPVIPFVGNAVLFFCGGLAKYILWICDKVANLPFSTVSIKTLPWLLWLVSVYLLFAIGWLLYRKRGVLFGATSSALILGVLLLLNQAVAHNRLTVQMIPSDTDLAAYVQADGCHVLVLSLSSTDVLKPTVQQLKRQGVSHIDTVVFVGGKTNAVSVSPGVLDKLVTKETQCVYADISVPFIGRELSQKEMSFGKNGDLIFKNGFLQIATGDNRVLFATSTAQREQLPSEFLEIPLLFSAGKVEFLSGAQKGCVLQQPLPTLVLQKGEVRYNRR